MEQMSAVEVSLNLSQMLWTQLIDVKITDNISKSRTNIMDYMHYTPHYKCFM